MYKIVTELTEIKLVGIKTRTNNKAEFKPENAKIGAMIQAYDNHNISDKIIVRKTPGVVYCIYTEYESDLHGDYTYFIGEEVDNFDNVSEQLSKLIIPNQKYVKFTTDQGIMPGVCINAWKEIWQMDASMLGGTRGYIADFEVYDKRAQDPNNTVLDIYIGIKG